MDPLTAPIRPSILLSLTTIPPPNTPLPHPTQVFRAILKSEVLREAISDLSDLPGASTVRVTVSNDEPYFHLSSGGNYGSLELFLPRTSEVGGCVRGWVSGNGCVPVCGMCRQACMCDGPT